MSSQLIASPASISPPLLPLFYFLLPVIWFQTDIPAPPWPCASRKVATAPALGEDLDWSKSGFLYFSTTDTSIEILLSCGRGWPLHLKDGFSVLLASTNKSAISTPFPNHDNQICLKALPGGWGWGGDKITPVGNQQSKLIIVVPLFLPLINLDIGIWCISGQNNWMEVC